LYVVFFFSGFPALIYQLVWERALFAIYGINIESVTIVVSSFMLGLGLGSLFGGKLSQRARLPLLVVFGLIELGIAGYGLVSLRFFHWVASFSSGATLSQTAFFTFLLLLIPTVLMGSTLPLLVAHMVRTSKSVGRSVSKLYFVNTLGSAVVCFLAAAIIMGALGESGGVLLAAALNICVGVTVLFFWWHGRKRNTASSFLAKDGKESEPASPRFAYISFALSLGIATLTGFIALGYEIIWYRVFSYITEGTAASLPLLLGWYLGGVALGSFLAERFCRERADADEKAGHWITLIAVFIIAANLVGFLTVPVLAWAVHLVSYRLAFPIVGLATASLGAVFPLIAHAAVRPDSDSGARLSYLYLANIVGSASGSFVIGFIAMDHWLLSRVCLVLALIGLFIGAALLASSGSRKKIIPALGGCLAVALLTIGVNGTLFHDLYTKLYYKRGLMPASTSQPFVQIIENKSGVIAVTRDRMVFGGGVYDGQFNTDLRHDSNMIVRAFALSSFHQSPRRVLMIGLASGSWAQIIANHPQLEELVIVEINPGYLRLIPQYPEVSSLLKNTKVKIAIDDGRRWLLRNPNEKFDAVVMNTTFSWRAHASDLLSTDFLQIVRQHLNPGGVLYYNATGSGAAFLTGATVFPYGLRVLNCLAVSDSPIKVDKERWRAILVQYTIDGRPVLDLSVPADQTRLEEVLHLADINIPSTQFYAMEYADSLRERYRGNRLITDDNMGNEW
jgi:spermidine synthase